MLRRERKCGAQTGAGSPREMLEALGGGQAFVVHVADDEEYHVAGAPPFCGDLLTRVAAGLELARDLNAGALKIPKPRPARRAAKPKPKRQAK